MGCIVKKTINGAKTVDDLVRKYFNFACAVDTPMSWKDAGFIIFTIGIITTPFIFIIGSRALIFFLMVSGTVFLMIGYVEMAERAKRNKRIVVMMDAMLTFTEKRTPTRVAFSWQCPGCDFKSCIDYPVDECESVRQETLADIKEIVTKHLFRVHDAAGKFPFFNVNSMKK